MPDKSTNTITRDATVRAREQLHDLSAGFREVARALGVPAGIGDDRDEDEDYGDVPAEEDIIGPATSSQSTQGGNR